MTYDVAKKAEKIVAIDLSEQNISFAKIKFPGKNIEYVFGDALTDLPNDKFDVILLSNVLEYIEKG